VGAFKIMEVNKMKRQYKLENLDCANCAAKIEEDISKMQGVNSANLNFMTAKLTVEFDDTLKPTIADSIQNIIYKYESNVILKRA
jgi:hypothetical protein